MKPALTPTSEVDLELAKKEERRKKSELAAQRNRERYQMALERIENKRQLIGASYGDDDCIDPSLIKINGLQAEPDYERHNNFATVLRGYNDQHLVLDIEAFSKEPDKLHLACMLDVDDTSKRKVYRTWIDIEQDLAFLVARNHKTRVWAHYGSMYDYTGLCRNLGISRDVSVTKTYTLVPSKKTGKRGRPSAAKTIEITWKVVAYGDRQEVQGKADIGKRKHAILLSDSGYHLPAALKTFGAKTRTPAQYTRPLEWIERMKSRVDESTYQEIVSKQREDFPSISNWKDDELFWHACVTRTAEQYCVMDCEILAKALNAYRDIVRDLSGGYQIDPLDFMTSPQVGLALSIVMAPMPKGWDHSLWIYSPSLYRKDSNVRFFRKEVRDIPSEDLTMIMDKPVATMDSNELMFSKVGWSVPGKIAAEMVNHLVGGRTEIFATRTAPGMRPMVIDARSMYPSMMASMRFVNPMTMNNVIIPIKGRQNILKHLEKRSGLFKVEIARPENSLMRQFPVIPVKMAGKSEDSRLLWPDWEGKLRCMVSGEELRYLLENSAIENDDVTITGGWHGILMTQSESPLAQFAARLYGARKNARKIGKILDASLLKILMNAGGFGPHAEQREKEEIFIMPLRNDSEERFEEAAIQMLEILSKLQDMDPLFDWTPIAKLQEMHPSVWLKKAIEDIEYWSMLTWRPLQSYINAEDRKVYSIGVSRFLVSHSIVPWAIQITSAGRVTLHWAISVAARLGFQICYTDTDSIHLGIPKDMTDEEFIELMGKSGITIGEDLGEWGIEYDKINGCDNALFIAKKTYAYLKGNEVKGFVAKGVSRGNRYLRAAMITIEESVPKIGSKLGLDGWIRHADAFAGIANSLPRRNYAEPYSSGPLVLKQLNEHSSMTCGNYAKAMSAQHYGKRKALLSAMNDYIENCTYVGVKISSLRAASRRVIDRVESMKASDDWVAGSLDKLIKKEIEKCKKAQ